MKTDALQEITRHPVDVDGIAAFGELVWASFGRGCAPLCQQKPPPSQTALNAARRALTTPKVGGGPLGVKKQRTDP